MHYIIASIIVLIVLIITYYVYTREFIGHNTPNNPNPPPNPATASASIAAYKAINMIILDQSYIDTNINTYMTDLSSYAATLADYLPQSNVIYKQKFKPFSLDITQNLLDFTNVTNPYLTLLFTFLGNLNTIINESIAARPNIVKFAGNCSLIGKQTASYLSINKFFWNYFINNAVCCGADYSIQNDNNVIVTAYNIYSFCVNYILIPYYNELIVEINHFIMAICNYYCYTNTGLACVNNQQVVGLYAYDSSLLSSFTTPKYTCYG